MAIYRWQLAAKDRLALDQKSLAFIQQDSICLAADAGFCSHNCNHHTLTRYGQQNQENVSPKLKATFLTDQNEFSWDLMLRHSLFGRNWKIKLKFPWSEHWLLSSFRRGRNVKKQNQIEFNVKAVQGCFGSCRKGFLKTRHFAVERVTMELVSIWPSLPFYVMTSQAQKAKKCCEMHQNIMLPRLSKYSSGRTQCMHKYLQYVCIYIYIIWCKSNTSNAWCVEPKALTVVPCWRRSLLRLAV